MDIRSLLTEADGFLSDEYLEKISIRINRKEFQLSQNTFVFVFHHAGIFQIDVLPSVDGT